MKVLIITGGNIDDDFAFSFLSDKNYDEVIAVDGGLAFVDRAQAVLQNFKLTHLVGDFDTIASDILEKYIHQEDICVHQYVPEKDYTDTDIAVKLALKLIESASAYDLIGSNEKDKNSIHILGGTGTRLDHVMANLQMLKNIMDTGAEGAVIDANNYIEMICGIRKLNRLEIFGKYMSLIPATMELKGITLEGVKYPLKNAGTAFGESLCVSNEIIEDVACIQIKEGIAWMILSRD